MLKRNFWVSGVMTAAVVALAPAALAQADRVVITGESQVATDMDLMHQEAAPTRHFGVEKATTLAPGQSRFNANLQVGGLGTGGTAPGIAGGVNLRADTSLAPGWEGGISVTGLGAGGANNLLGNINLNAKTQLTDLMLGSTPVSVAGLATAGALASGGGIGSATVGLGIPLTAAFTPNLNATLVPGLAFGFSGGGLLPGGATPMVGASGLIPALGIGADWALTDRLSALVDANVGFSGGFLTTGNVGVRYGFTDNLAGDLFARYESNPFNAFQTVGAGTIGVGGFYAF